MMPVCTPTGAGRSSNALVDIFCENQRKKLSECDVLDSVVYVSKFQGLSLQEYCDVKYILCETNHAAEKFCDCKALINCAITVLNVGIISLSQVFRNNFPNVTYSFNN